MALLWVFGVFLMFLFRASALTAPTILADPDEVSNLTSATLTCNLTDPPSAIKGHYWTKNGKEIVTTRVESQATHTEYNLPKIDHNNGGKYACVFISTEEFSKTIEVKTPPHVSAYKHSEHGNEKDVGKLTCVSHSYPLPNDWTWYLISNGEKTPIVNGTEKFEIESTPEKTILQVFNLDMEKDMGDYMCFGQNEFGMASDKIHLRVRSRFAALWPFLGIVVEVIILIAIIFIYEKRRKPDEITDDDDSGSAPLKSNSSTNHKEKNVRQRNSN
ncbi:basigin [Conger conger]|uniref:basigin n=1 Tax=Conger conger TaxID=82655 RepID=UPI002A5AEB2E|nr:basigin [Conger conger]